MGGRFVDYESMSTPELQQECKRRGLQSGRAKVDLVARLTEHDEAETNPDDDFIDTPVVEASPDPDLLRDVLVHEVLTVDAPEPPVASVGPDPLPDPAPTAAAPTVFRSSFAARPDGPSDAEHLDYRRRTRAAAVAEGLSPRGDAYRVGTAAGHEVYEINFRRVT
jgi:hypothetical protein